MPKAREYGNAAKNSEKALKAPIRDLCGTGHHWYEKNVLKNSCRFRIFGAYRFFFPPFSQNKHFEDKNAYCSLPRNVIKDQIHFRTNFVQRDKRLRNAHILIAFLF